MVEKQILWRGIKKQTVLEAMSKVPREEFVLPQYKDKSYADITVPIGRGENLDRPYDDAYILNALNLTSEDKVLEIGTGSGYLTALLSRNAGKVYTIDIIPEFTEEAVKRFKQLGYTNIIAKAGDGFLGWPEFAPFDAIVLTCSPTDIPQPIAEQLAENGRMLIPLGGKDKFQDLLLFYKLNGQLTKPKLLSGASFSPMQGKALESGSGVLNPH